MSGEADRGRLRTQYLRFRAALRDPTTGLYGFTLFFDRIRTLVTRDGRIGVLWVGIGGRDLVEPVYGWEAYESLLRGAAGEIRSCIGSLLPTESLLATAAVHADAFVLFVPSDVAGTPVAAASLAETAAQLRERLRRSLLEGGGPAAFGERPAVGSSLLTDNPMQRFERRVLRAVDEARAQAEKPAGAERVVWIAELQRIVREGRIATVFQPVVALEDESVVAVEAYARGPERSALRLPRVLFGLSRDAGLSDRLDRACRDAALEAARGLPEPLLLFLNATPALLDAGAWGRSLADGPEPGRLVIEVAEASLEAGTGGLGERVGELRRQGFRISLDDVGSGSHSIELAEALRPDFLKFDLAALRGAASPSMAREIVRTLVDLARRVGATLVAERVERPGERKMLIECGVRWGQGYLFGHEGPLPAGRERAAERERPGK